MARRDWTRALAALPATEIKAAADTITRTHEVQDIRLPQAGLGLLTLRDGAFHEPFYLGEVPEPMRYRFTTPWLALNE